MTAALAVVRRVSAPEPGTGPENTSKFQQGSLKDIFCHHLKHVFFHQNKEKPPFTRRCSAETKPSIPQGNEIDSGKASFVSLWE